MDRETLIIQTALAQADRLRQRHGEPAQVNLSVYASDADLRQLRPEDGEDVTAAQQRRIVEKVAHELRQRKFIVRLITLRAVDYLKWLSDTGKNNNAGTRAEFISWKTK